MGHRYRVNKLCDGIWHIDEVGLGSAYIIHGKSRGLLIDTGTGIDDLRGLVEKFLDVPYDVVLTHGHVDHAGGISQFDEVYINEKDIAMVDSITLQNRESYISSMYFANATDVQPADIIEEMRTNEKCRYIPIKSGDVFSLGNRAIKVFECPGHTSGSICLCDEVSGLIFSGDSMNEIELLCAPAEDRMQLLGTWYEIGQTILSSQKFILCCGGHGVFSPEKAWEILECGRKILSNELQMKRMKKHIFTGNFAKYKNSYITLDEVLERE